MLSAASKRLLPLAAPLRGISTASPCLAEGEGAPVDTGAKAFTERFRHHVSSTMNAPNFPTDFLKKKEVKEGEPVPEKMKINFFLPHEQILKQAEARPRLACIQTSPPGVQAVKGSWIQGCEGVSRWCAAEGLCLVPRLCTKVLACLAVAVGNDKQDGAGSHPRLTETIGSPAAYSWCFSH